MFAAVTFKTLISCNLIFTKDSQLTHQKGGGAGQGPWSRGSGEARKTHHETGGF